MNDKDKKVVELVNARTDQLASLLGSPEAVERFKTVALNAVVNNSALQGCDTLSIVEAIRESATLGLEPTGALGEAAILPYKGKAQLRPMFRGYLKMARNSGEVAAVDAFVVYANDEWDLWSDENGPHWKHRPFLNAPLGEPDAPNRGDLRGVFGYARLTNGELLQRWMPVQEIELARKASPSVKANRSSPWDGWYDQMALKTVIRRLCKMLPLSAQAQRLLIRDNELDDAERAEKAKPIAANSVQARALAAVNQRRGIEEPEADEEAAPEPAEPEAQPEADERQPSEAPEEPATEASPETAQAVAEGKVDGQTGEVKEATAFERSMTDAGADDGLLGRAP